MPTDKKLPVHSKKKNTQIHTKGDLDAKKGNLKESTNKPKKPNTKGAPDNADPNAQYEDKDES